MTYVEICSQIAVLESMEYSSKPEYAAPAYNADQHELGILYWNVKRIQDSCRSEECLNCGGCYADIGQLKTRLCSDCNEIWLDAINSRM